MYLKIEQNSPMYAKLFDILKKEEQRNEDFIKWQEENLPEFNHNTLTQRSPWYIYSSVVGWKFEGDIDRKTWKEVKDWPGYYEPNKRTKAGKEMQERILKARGQRFNRLGFFDLFKTTTPRYGQSFTVPIGFIYEDAIYFVFDDGNYKDIKEHCAEMYTEITHGEWDELIDKYNKQ